MTFCHRVISCHYKRQNQHNNWNSPRETCALWVMYWYGVTLTVTYNYNAAADDRRHILQVNIITFQWWAWSRDQWRRCCASPPPRPPLGSSRPAGGCCRHGRGPGCSRPSCPAPGTWETPLHNSVSQFDTNRYNSPHSLDISHSICNCGNCIPFSRILSPTLSSMILCTASSIFSIASLFSVTLLGSSSRASMLAGLPFLAAMSWAVSPSPVLSDLRAPKCNSLMMTRLSVTCNTGQSPSLSHLSHLHSRSSQPSGELSRGTSSSAPPPPPPGRPPASFSAWRCWSGDDGPQRSGARPPTLRFPPARPTPRTPRPDERRKRRHRRWEDTREAGRGPTCSDASLRLRTSTALTLFTDWKSDQNWQLYDENTL